MFPDPGKCARIEPAAYRTDGSGEKRSAAAQSVQKYAVRAPWSRAQHLDSARL